MPAVVVGGQTEDCGVVAGFGVALLALSGAVVPFGKVPCCGVYGSAFGICGCATGAAVDGVGEVVVVVGVCGDVVLGEPATGVPEGAATAALPRSARPSAAVQTDVILVMARFPYLFSAE